MPFAPTPHTIAHIARYEDTSLPVDEHGNFQVVEDPPVLRKIYDVSQFGRRGSSRQVLGPEYEDRTDTVWHLSVPNPEVYRSGDQILMNLTDENQLGAEVVSLDDAGNVIPDDVSAYWVDGVPAEDRLSPWPRYTHQFGGVVKVRRVT